MHYTKPIVLSLALLSPVMKAIAQSAPQPPKEFASIKIPPSPEAAQLGKYGEVPVSLYTGALNYSIPLTTISSGRLSIPVSLDYSTDGGIVVSNVANNVGLGWSIGGLSLVSREVVSTPDDWTYGFLYTLANYTQDELNQKTTNQTDIDHLIRLYKADRGCLDFQSDNYFYRLGNLSGKFHFNWNGDVVNQNQNAVKISYVRGGTQIAPITSWIITTDDGTKYMFSSAEVTQRHTELTGNPYCELPNYSFNSSWYLTKVEDVNGNYIDFEYESYSYRRNMELSHSVGVKDQITTSYIGTCLSSEQYASNNMTAYGLENNGVPAKQGLNLTYYQKRIKAIRSSKGVSVEFEYNTTRTDDESLSVPSSFQSLDKVKLVEGTSLMKSWDLSHNYTTNRLTFSKLTEKSPANEEGKVYAFTYNSSIPASVNSYDIDHWGYANGSGTSQGISLVPNFVHKINTTLSYNGTPYQQIIFYKDGADREPKSNSLNGLLKKITYPTGGTSEFIYEMHDCSNVSNQTIASFGLHPETNVTISAFAQANSSGQRQVDVQTFQVTDTTVGVMLYFNAHIGADNSGCWPAKKPKMILNKLNGSTVTLIKQRQFQYTNPGDQTEGSYSDWDYVELEPGTYQLRAEAECNANGFDEASIVATFKQPDLSKVLTRIPVGGARIKEIKNTDPFSVLTNRKTYKYTNPSDTSLSSGVILAMPDYKTIASEYQGHDQAAYNWEAYQTGGVAIDQFCYTRVNKTVYLSQSGVMTEGAHIGYQYVAEEEDNNGKRVYHYTSPAIYSGGVSFHYPFMPPDNAETYKMGLLLDEKDYNTAGTVVRKNEITYDFIDSANEVKVIKYKGNDDFLDPSKLTPVGNIMSHYIYLYQNFFELTSYYTKKGYSRMRSSKETMYNDDGTTFTEKTTQTNYHPVVKQMPMEQVTVNSDGKEYKSVFTYPFDQAGTAVFQEMINRNMISEPVAVSMQVNGQQIQQSKKTYNTFQNNMVLLASELYAEGTSTPAAEITYDAYDNTGNLLRYTKRGGEKGAILWGYNGRYMVARLDHIDHTALQAYLNNSPVIQQTFDNPSSATALLAAVQQLRAAFPDAMVSGYSYLPNVGINSISDANNQMNYYEYDGLGRLLNIKDANNNLLKTYEYKYQQN
ncbi:hypothetical protein D3C71_89460 [compost metagenome]